MKKLFYLPLLILVVFAGCSSDSDSPTDPAPVDPPIVSGTIGSGGGSLASDLVILEIPAGALVGDAQLKIYLDTEQDPFGDETASGVIRLEGLPDDFTLPVTIKLAHETADPDSLFAMLGGESWIPSLQESHVTWMMEDCRDSLGWAIMDLPPASALSGKAATSTPIFVTTVKGVSHLETSDGHFRIYWSPRMATTAQVVNLRDYIEEAMTLYDLMGFEQIGFDDWPVKVAIEPLNWYGHWAPDPRKLGGELAFSTKYIHDDVEIHLTAGHELLHFCQYFYDPRSIWDRGSKANPNSWLDEATAVYIEDYFAPSAEYCSAARGGRELTALDGLISPNGRTLAEHGYGQSSIIRYLADTEGDDFILKTYADISQGTHAVAALQNQTDTDLQDVWQDLLEELVTGNIYSDVTIPVLVKYGVYYMQTINSAADSVGTFALDYPDLSGQTFYIRWGDGYSFNDNQRMEFWCDDAPEYGLSIYGMKDPDTRDLLGHAYGKIVLGNLPKIKDDYQVLMAMVSNHHLAGPDYFGPTGITIQSRLRESENIGRYDHAKILIRYEADWSNSSSNIYSQDMTFVEVSGSFSGTSFSALWDSTGSGDVHYTGHINVSLDPGTLHVVSWSAQNYADHPDGWSKNFQASGSALPDVSYNTLSLSGIVEDEATCNSIGGLSVTFVDNEGLTTLNLDGHTCNPTSYVKVFLYNRDPD